MYLYTNMYDGADKSFNSYNNFIFSGKCIQKYNVRHHFYYSLNKKLIMISLT